MHSKPIHQHFHHFYNNTSNNKTSNNSTNYNNKTSNLQKKSAAEKPTTQLTRVQDDVKDSRGKWKRRIKAKQRGGGGVGGCVEEQTFVA